MTSFRLAEHTAAELYVRDVARLLHTGGVQVAIFASRTGALANELRKEGIEVADHPLTRSFTPDLIHGQGNLEAIAAILAHPGVPAVFLSQGGASWREQPPRHPRIYRYLSSSFAGRSWLQRQPGIPPSRVAALPEFVDSSLLGEPRRVPVKPSTALYCDYLPETGALDGLLRRACQELGIRLDTVSGLACQVSTRPADVFSRYDLVFAAGKTVLQALATGCGVLAVSGGSFGELVTVNNFDRVSASGFPARRAFKSEPLMLAELVAEIETWDWSSLSPLASRVRELHGENSVRGRLLELYGAVLAEAALLPNDCLSELPAVADWILELTERHHQLDLGYLELQQRTRILKTDRTRWSAQNQALETQLELEREKVRCARRLLQDGSVFHHKLKWKIEESWREIETRDESRRESSDQPGRNSSVDLSG